MSGEQIRTIRDYFKEIRKYAEKSKCFDDLNSQWAQDEDNRLSGYIFALYQFEIITEKQYYRILEISRNWTFYGNSKGKEAA